MRAHFFSTVPCRLYSTGLICTAAALAMVFTVLSFQAECLSGLRSMLPRLHGSRRTQHAPRGLRIDMRSGLTPTWHAMIPVFKVLTVEDKVASFDGRVAGEAGVVHRLVGGFAVVEMSEPPAAGRGVFS